MVNNWHIPDLEHAVFEIDYPRGASHKVTVAFKALFLQIYYTLKYSDAAVHNLPCTFKNKNRPPF